MNLLREYRIRTCATNCRRATRAGIWLWLLAALGGCFVIAGVVVVNAVTLNRDARALRRAMLESLDARPTLRIQLSVGPVLLDAAQLVLRVVDQVPEEARLALSAARAASVGVYEFPNAPVEVSSRTIAAADAAMSARGWTRSVAVAQRHETVLVYTRDSAEADDSQPLQICVGVCNGRQLVVVSTKVMPAPLLELAAKHRGTARL